MRKNMYGRYLLGLASFFLLSSCQQTSIQGGDLIVLASAPTTLKQYKEIAVQYNDETPAAFTNLAPEERIFIYYLFRASLPGNRIVADQLHRHSLEIIDIFETIFNAREQLNEEAQFFAEVEILLVYLWTNHGLYFQREHAHEKRTPRRLGLATITKERIIAALTKLGVTNAAERVDAIALSLFDEDYESTCTIPNNIEQSAVNFYSSDFTEKDYHALPVDQRTKLNSYCYIEMKELTRVPRIIPYSAQAKYGQELTVANYWLKKAHEHVQRNPKFFDAHLIKSLEYLIQFLETSDEEFFKRHSIEWLKSSSKVDYNFGFIETYNDPKGNRGLFQAEATVKIFDITKLNALLPAIEQKFPLPSEFKRESLEKGGIPNASINQKMFGTGGLGPLIVTAAYNLPNYEEIRSRYGSKQIIYPASKSLEMRINPTLARKLFHRSKEAEWLTTNDPEGHLDNDLWNVHCILHETVGHGSGKLALHIFKEGEPLTIGGTVYKVGDTMQITHDTLVELLGGHAHTIEELRAEIIALYVSINHLDELIECNMLKQWPTLLSKQQLIEQSILHMARTSLKRLLQQSDNATEISGDHARANTVITNYLVDHGGLEFIEEKIVVNGNEHTIVDIGIKNLELAIQGITNLFILVQQIKSTGDGLQAKELIETYGRPIRNPQHLKALKENRKAIIGELKASAHLYPHFIPVYDMWKNIKDVHAVWPQDIFEQYAWYEKLELSTKNPE